MYKISPNIDTIGSAASSCITIVGAGHVAQSILLLASLLDSKLAFRVICHTERSAELLRCFINDLPRLSVSIETAEVVPDLSGELVVLAVGIRTERYARRAKKEQLYRHNVQLISACLEQLKSSRVIVVTNPSTRITKFLVENGIEAYGVGVGNDQARFENQLREPQSGHFLVGGHNFYDLVIGSNGVTLPKDQPFSHDDYKKIVEQQDSCHVLFNQRTRSIFDYDWERLSEINDAFPSMYRWYARQRIHTKYHATTISCATSVLNIACMLLGVPTRSETVTVELPLNLPGLEADCVLGWPLRSASRTPIELYFNEQGLNRLQAVAGRYAIKSQVELIGAQDQFRFVTPFDTAISVFWDAGFAYEFHSKFMKHLVSVERLRSMNVPDQASIAVRRDGRFFEEAVEQGVRNLDGDLVWEKVPQHRGRNVQEHTDLLIARIGRKRAVRFPSGEAVALIDDDRRHVDFFSKDKAAVFHELRRIIRDEIALPMMVSAGCRICHAGIVEFEGLNILILGKSGGGKTTLALKLLCDDRNSKYGTAERTLVWLSGSQFMALGVPESITIFPGNLRGASAFADLIGDRESSADWSRDSKLRLQQDEIVNRTGTALIQGPVAVDLVVEVSYMPESDDKPAAVRTTSSNLERMLRENDLTANDTVRLEWLDWFPRQMDERFYKAIWTLPKLPEVARIEWHDEDALKEAVIDLVARMKMGRQLSL